jgi:hypothetical protein
MLATSKLDVVVADVDELVDEIAILLFLTNSLIVFLAGVCPVKKIYTTFKRLFLIDCLFLSLDLLQ